MFEHNERAKQRLRPVESDRKLFRKLSVGLIQFSIMADRSPVFGVSAAACMRRIFQRATANFLRYLEVGKH